MKDNFARILSIKNKKDIKNIGSKSTFQTTAPTEDISDGGVHIVFLEQEPTTKYDGYIYMIKEA